jgi:hypothetical protein
MKKTYILSIAAIAGLAAIASPISLLNASFENNTNAKLADAADEWGNSYAPEQGERGTQGIGNAGGWADHASFSAPDYDAVLGDNFAYYSARSAGEEFMGQWLPDRFEQGLVYTFSSWATADSATNESLTVTYEIGYLATDEDRDSYVQLAQTSYDTVHGWRDYAGVTYMAEGDAVGKQIVVAFGTDTSLDTASGGTWVDNAQLTAVPEPATMLALGAGLAALAARRKKKA